MCRFCEKLAYGDEEHKMIEPLAETKNIVLAVDDITSRFIREQMTPL